MPKSFSNSSSDSSDVEDAVDKIRKYVHIGPTHAKYSRSFTYHSTFNKPIKKKRMKIEIKERRKKIHVFEQSSMELKEGWTDDELVMDIKNVNVAMVNALRRIMIAEVPTIAVDTVVLNDNTSVLQDEILAHRIGLIPIKADPQQFRFQKNIFRTLKDIQSGEEVIEHEHTTPPELYETETVLFKLQVKCFRDKKGVIQNREVNSGHLKWVPFGNQLETFPDGISPVNDDILIVKLNPGQTIDCEIYCTKGVGKAHAKWSPVCTATYRQHPKIEFAQEISGKEAKMLVKTCPMQVFDIEDDTAYVKDARQCTMCRECVRVNDWDQKIKLYRKKEHFIMSIESTGSLKPEEIFKQSLRILHEKAKRKLAQLEEIRKEEEQSENQTLK